MPDVFSRCIIIFFGRFESIYSFLFCLESHEIILLLLSLAPASRTDTDPSHVSSLPPPPPPSRCCTSSRRVRLHQRPSSPLSNPAKNIRSQAQAQPSPAAPKPRKTSPKPALSTASLLLSASGSPALCSPAAPSCLVSTKASLAKREKTRLFIFLVCATDTSPSVMRPCRPFSN